MGPEGNEAPTLFPVAMFRGDENPAFVLKKQNGALRSQAERWDSFASGCSEPWRSQCVEKTGPHSATSPPLIDCQALDKSLNVLGPQCPCQLCGLNEIHTKLRPQWVTHQCFFFLFN